MTSSFWNNKRVLITGHTGFKGIWLCYLLNFLGAEVCGLGLPSIDPKSLIRKNSFKKISANEKYGIPAYNDINNYASVRSAYEKFEPEVVFHLAAQALVLEGIRAPYQTYQTNIIGTLNVLDCSTYSKSLRGLVSVTTDKVYQNMGREYSFVESDAVNGDSPYSASKACADIISMAHAEILTKRQVGLGVARAGNVVGGGDWAENRLIPDLMRAYYSGNKLEIRYPDAVRPWQFVIDLLFGYLTLAERIYCDPLIYSGAYNFSNMNDEVLKVRDIIKLVQECNDCTLDIEYVAPAEEEAAFLQLNAEKAIKLLNYKPHVNVKTALKLSMDWYSKYFSGHDVDKLYEEQINDYISAISNTSSGLARQ